MTQTPFQKVGRVRPRRSAFDLSHEHKTTCNLGELIPVTCFECMPGDSYKMFNEIVVRFQPMIAPILHSVDVYTHTFFVPYRLLWGSEDSMRWYPSEPVRAWEKFITGGKNNDFSTALPRWVPNTSFSGTTYLGRLWNHFGFATSVNSGDPGSNGISTSIGRDGFYPLDFPRRAYNYIFNTFYNDQDVGIIDDDGEAGVNWNNESILRRCWEKDYFTIARPSRQRGQVMAMPVTGKPSILYQQQPYATGTLSPIVVTLAGTNPGANNPAINMNLAGNNYTSPGRLTFNTGELATFDINDLRQVIQLQKWAERNQRAGIRYKEFIPAHFGVQIGDSRIDRPEYIGGTKSPVIISEVLQTQETSSVSPQGNMAGHGMSADTTKIGSYFVKEYGLIMTILSLRPRSTYKNEGINRQWLRRTRYDFPFPEFMHLSEQAVYKGEIICATHNDNNWNPWGFQGIYDELRYLPSVVSGDFKVVLDYWHLARNSPTGTASPTAWPLNKDFVTCNPSDRIFAVHQAPNPVTGNMEPVDNVLVNYAARIKAVRPMPFIAEPGLMDHF